MRLFRNIVVDGDHVSGEAESEIRPGEWYPFSGYIPLLKISVSMDENPDMLHIFMKHADGYGHAGFFPSGYDWSGIRDSSAAAIEKMAALADDWARVKVFVWPWVLNLN